MYDLWKAKKLPDNAWHPNRKHLLSMMTMPGTRHVWDCYAKAGQAAAFVAYVEALHASGELTYSLKDVLRGKASDETATTPGGQP